MFCLLGLQKISGSVLWMVQGDGFFSIICVEFIKHHFIKLYLSQHLVVLSNQGKTVSLDNTYGTSSSVLMTIYYLPSVSRPLAGVCGNLKARIVVIKG